jgi:hypothetical protein
VELFFIIFFGNGIRKGKKIMKKAGTEGGIAAQIKKIAF